MTFPAYATNFELHPSTGEAARHLKLLLLGLGRIDFSFNVADASANQGQASCDFDRALKRPLHARGASTFNLTLPPGVPQELDFAFSLESRTVGVEIEKANREKILRDILKCHIYLHAGADFALVALPKNYAHKHGVWNLFQFGVERYDECRTYGFGSPDTLEKNLLLGFDQRDAITNRLLSKATHKEMRSRATAQSEAT